MATNSLNSVELLRRLTLSTTCSVNNCVVVIHSPTIVKEDEMIDKPDCIDLKQLDKICSSRQKENNEVIVISDDEENDVIIVEDACPNNDQENIRRNPMRSARTKTRRNSSMYEKDLGFLDEINEKENKATKTRKKYQRVCTQPVPKNEHDRLTFSEDIIEIDDDDDDDDDDKCNSYNIRPKPQRIQRTQSSGARPKANVKRKRKGGRKKVKNEDMCPISELIESVESTTRSVKSLFEDNYESATFSKEFKADLYKSQLELLALVKMEARF